MKSIIISILLPLFFLGCASKPIVFSSNKTQLQLRDMQSKRIESSDVKLLSKIVLQVLLDDEFIIENANNELGFFSAKKKLDGGKESYKFAWYDIYYPIAIYKASTLSQLIKEVRVTISIRNYKNHSKIRASFNSDLYNDDNKLISSRIIDDPNFYKEFFSKLNKSMFLEKNNL